MWDKARSRLHFIAKRPFWWAIALAILAVGFIKDYGFTVMFRCPDPIRATRPIRNYVYLDELKNHVGTLAGKIGERNLFVAEGLRKAADYIRDTFKSNGYQPSAQTFSIGQIPVDNLIAEKVGTSQKDEILIVGAHYDTERGTPGANDNASGVAALLVLSRIIKDTPLARTVRFVAFANEEQPFFMTDQMGSQIYAQKLKQNHEKVVGMLSLETIGYFTEKRFSQKYPFPLRYFYPSEGNFIGIVGNLHSRGLVNVLTSLFRTYSDLPVQCIKTFEKLPGVAWSDHASFWKQGYQAAMITDTAPFRYPYYHTSEDKPDKIDYEKLDKVVEGLKGAIEAFANDKSPEA